MSNLGESLQPKFAKQSICFGCGPANALGLHIESKPVLDSPESESALVATWRARPEHQAFPGMLNGGIIGALLDCHSNWTAAWHLMRLQGLEHPPCTVTAEYKINLLRPTPVDSEIILHSKVVHPAEGESRSDRAWIEATLTAGGKVCATCRGLFVQVKPGHPAYHRW